MRIKKQAFQIYITDELKEELKKEAEKKGLSLNSYINMILMERSK